MTRFYICNDCGREYSLTIKKPGPKKIAQSVLYALFGAGSGSIWGVPDKDVYQCPHCGSFNTKKLRKK